MKDLIARARRSRGETEQALVEEVEACAEEDSCRACTPRRRHENPCRVSWRCDVMQCDREVRLETAAPARFVDTQANGTNGEIDFF